MTTIFCISLYFFFRNDSSIPVFLPVLFAELIFCLFSISASYFLFVLFLMKLSLMIASSIAKYWRKFSHHNPSITLSKLHLLLSQHFLHQQLPHLVISTLVYSSYSFEFTFTECQKPRMTYSLSYSHASALIRVGPPKRITAFEYCVPSFDTSNKLKYSVCQIIVSLPSQKKMNKINVYDAPSFLSPSKAQQMEEVFY